MSCSPFDLRDYFLKELPDPQGRQVESHVRSCPACREELQRLQLTEAALFVLKDEEVPQRIAFVSDPVFEPSRARRWWSAFWAAPGRIGFASAAMLSAALVFAAVRTRPAPAPAVTTAPPAQVVTTAAVVPEKEIDRLVKSAVEQALTASEARQSEKTKALVSELEQMRMRLLVTAQELEMSQKRANSLRASLYGPPEREVGGGR